jgi:hypothetical protein
MAKAEVFEGRSRSLAIDRIAILASGQTALFFESFENDYHIYGTQRPTPYEVLTTAFDITRAITPNAMELATYRVLTATVAITIEKPTKLHELKAIISAQASDITYMDITTAAGHLWADINAGRTAHFGFATPLRIHDKPLDFLRQLTPVPLDDADLADIANILRTYTSERYRVQ